MLRAASALNPGAVAITGGQITGTNVPYVLSHSAIPFIHLSSGSVAANGAISAITALPRAYPSAYCYFPANALATVLAAGWYYCTFSTTTAGVAFLNTYTTGTPTIPAVPTAVSDGKGAFTGDVTERAAQTITIPANAIGPNGYVEVYALWTGNGAAGARVAKLRFGGAAGTAHVQVDQTTNLSFVARKVISNVGVTNTQVGGTASLSFETSSAAATTSSVDTTAAVDVVFNVAKATATNNHTVEQYFVAIRYGA